MNEILGEIVVVFGLILLNGFFSGTEMALISMRKSRLKQLVKEGNKKAVLAEKLLQNPEEFLATIQVGITLVSTIASAFAGANIAHAISPTLKGLSIPFISDNAESISLAFIVIGITFLTVIIGELIPKSLGIKFSEKFSLFVVTPVFYLSKISFPITKLLSASSNIFLKLFSDKTSFTEAKITEEELRTILYESHKAGTLKKYEHEILDNVFDFSDIAVEQIMTPKSKIFALDTSEPNEKNIQKIIDSGYTRIPLYRDNIDNIVGTVNIKYLLKEMQKNRNPLLTDVSVKPIFVPNTQRISDLLKKFQREKIHMAIVTNEHGDVDGLVTIEDIIEEIVGDIADESDEEMKQITRLKDGGYLVEGSTSMVDFNRHFKTDFAEDDQFTTVSGLLLDTLETIPEVGTKTVIENIEFTIREKNERTIKSVGVRKLRKE